MSRSALKKRFMEFSSDHAQLGRFGVAQTSINDKLSFFYNDCEHLRKIRLLIKGVWVALLIDLIGIFLMTLAKAIPCLI